jgi:hypothetical protein
MASGGARNRSGPQPDPNSLRGAARAALRVLPNVKFNRAIPEFDLPNATVREDKLWRTAWESPQAWAWIEEPWRWQFIAMWVRRTAMAESDEANAAEVAAMIRLADQIGMTPAGLKENGWTIGAEKAPAGQGEPKASSPTSSTRDRFRIVRDGDAALCRRLPCLVDRPGLDSGALPSP